MRLEQFVAEREPRWAELEQLVTRARQSPERLGSAGVRRLGALYRAAVADLALARRRFPGESVVARLDGLVGRGRGLVYRSERRRESVGHFVTTGYFRRVRERPVPLLVAAVLLLAPWVLASLWAVRDPGAAAGLAPRGAQSVVERQSADFGLSADQKAEVASAIFTNNIRVALLAFALGITAAIGAAAVLVYQGIALGATFGLTIQAGNARVLWEFVVPHGVLEISCIIVAGAAGLRMGYAIVAPGRRRRRVALAEEARKSVEIALGTALWLVVAGLIEGNLSTSGIGVGPGLVVGVGLGALFWGLVAWRGRPERELVGGDGDGDDGGGGGGGDALPARPLRGAPAPLP